MAISWVATNAVTGEIRADFQDFQPDGAIGSTLGSYFTITGTLPLPDAVVMSAQNGDTNSASLLDEWYSATEKFATILYALDESDMPIAGYIITGRKTNHTENATLSLMSLEGYLDKRYTGAFTYTGDQNLLVKSLVEGRCKDGATYTDPDGGTHVVPGLALRVAIPAGDVGPTITRSYLEADDKTVYSVLTDLMASGGPEWSFTYEWQNTPVRITPVFNVATRIGSDPIPGLQPNALFSLPGCVLTAEVNEDYTAGKGANIVTATSTSAGAVRPAKAAITSDFEGRLAVEYRYTPAQSIGASLLVTYASEALVALRHGTNSLAITADRRTGPQLGIDWNLGDTVAYDLTAPAWLTSLTGNARVIGWQMTDDVISPILAI